MIPTILVLGFGAGLITGRLGALFIPLAALAWSLGLSETNICEGVCQSGAAFSAAVNAALGVGVGYTLHIAAGRLFRAT